MGFPVYYETEKTRLQRFLKPSDSLRNKKRELVRLAILCDRDGNEKALVFDRKASAEEKGRARDA